MGKFTATVFFLCAVIGSIFLDVSIHENKFSKSLTGQTLKAYGGYEHGLFAYEYMADTTRWLKAKAPEYWVSFMEASAPYTRLIRELALITRNILTKIYVSLVGEYYPAVENWVQKNLPGMRDATYNAMVKMYGVAKNGTTQAVTYLQSEVFVGSWSADNMKRITLEALNTTQHYASNTITWIYDTIGSAQKTART